MNKADLIDALEGVLGSRKAASDAIESLVDVIIREVASGGKVAITGFGTFEPTARAARTGRNPRTGETVRIEATTSPTFRPGTQFKELVADPARLPASGLAGARASASPAAAPAARRRISARAAAPTAPTARTTRSRGAAAVAATGDEELSALDSARAHVVEVAKEKAKKKAAGKASPKKAKSKSGKGDPVAEAKKDPARAGKKSGKKDAAKKR